jgi:hypothetical protein
VALADDLRVQDPRVGHHQQPQIAHDVGGQRLVIDVVAVDVEPEALALDRATVCEVDLEVELRASVIGVRHE